MGHNTQAWIRYGSVTYTIRPNSVIRIGRSIDSDIRLFDDTAVSRDHCTISFINDRLEVKDLDSRNGTRVNGRLISSPTELRHKDVIQVGDTELTVLLELDPDDRSTASGFSVSP